MATYNNHLQYRQRSHLISGGYGRVNGAPKYNCTGCTTGDCCFVKGTNCDRVEVVDGTCGVRQEYLEWIDAPDNNSEGVSFEYNWRDSNYALNSVSQRGVAHATTTWTSQQLEGNVLRVTATVTIDHIYRDDVRGNPDLRIYRRMAIKNAETNATLWIQNGASPINRNGVGTVMNTPVSITRTFDILPQQTSVTTYIAKIRNWCSTSTGGNFNGAGENSGIELYVDEMAIGAEFRNSLPNKFNPPVLRTIDQVRDICEDVVDANMIFEGPTLANGKIEVQWRLEGQDWNDSRKAVASGTVGEVVEDLWLEDLPPRNTKIYWRARWVGAEYLEPSDWVYGDFETLWFPAPNQTVPDITDQDCARIGRGELIDEITSSDQVYGWVKGEDL